ncbi:helix-turn-helix domain-containing protein [Bacteroides sp. 519]|uniref:helix-turn-helix domain-containing protein n=1 Tax=Bacteroides sp. 519 TaxID=2302937 RepID=UPI0013CFC606|nr:helix-turn-helix domain-containing protein [Bacteroides sp. 519]NDV56704.1 DNA-binding protein [Bacteroides sp. 519]
MDNDDIRKWMQEWFERFMNRFDRLDENLGNMSGRYNFLDGERLLDNQDLCQLLHVTKRTLQRYRATGELKFYTIHQKPYYKEGDVDAFINARFSKGENEEPEQPDGEEPETEPDE